MSICYHKFLPVLIHNQKYLIVLPLPFFDLLHRAKPKCSLISVNGGGLNNHKLIGLILSLITVIDDTVFVFLFAVPILKMEAH